MRAREATGTTILMSAVQGANTRDAMRSPLAIQGQSNVVIEQVRCHAGQDMQMMALMPLPIATQEETDVGNAIASVDSVIMMFKNGNAWSAMEGFAQSAKPVYTFKFSDKKMLTYSRSEMESEVRRLLYSCLNPSSRARMMVTQVFIVGNHLYVPDDKNVTGPKLADFIKIKWVKVDAPALPCTWPGKMYSITRLSSKPIFPV